MTYELKNAVINSVLCFIFSSRKTLSCNEITSMAVVHFLKEEIETAKKFIFKLCGEKPIARVSCPRWPDPCTAHIDDITDLIERHEAKNFLFPKFLTQEFDSMPPAGISRIAESINSLRDEISALRYELCELRKERASDIKALEDINNVQSDVADIKTAIMANVQNCGSAVGPGNRNALSYASITKRNNVSTNGNAPTLKSHVPGVNGGRRNSAAGVGGVMSAPVSSVRTGTSRGSLPSQRKNRGVLGTRKGSSSSKLSSAPRNLDVFVSRCLPDTKCDEIIAFCDEGGVTVQECELLKTGYSSCESFKITVKSTDRDALLDASFWPEGIVARKFFSARKKRVNFDPGNSGSSTLGQHE